MEGLDCLGADVGFDYTSLIKGLAGGLQGAGGLISGQKPGTPAAAADAERIRLQMEKEAAERRASTLKIVLIALGSLAGVGILVALLRK